MIKNKFESMKKGFLPLRFYSVIIVLGIVIFSLSAFSAMTDNFSLLNKQPKGTSNTDLSFKQLEKIRNNQNTGKIEPADIKRVQEELKSFENSREGDDLQWKQIGPDNFGGSTRAIIFDNQNTENPVVYAGGTTGGLWKSTNLGITWQKINMDTYNLNVSSMTQTTNGDIYVGTGELFNVQIMNGLNQMGYSTGFMGQGIFKSTDGENFELLQSTIPQISDVNSDWAFINEMANDLTNGRIYAATNTGLKYSNDGGSSWSTAKDKDGNELTMNTLDIKVGSEGNVIACIDEMCYISTNGDVNSFMNRSTGDSVSLPSSGVGRIEFAIAPSDANIVYASVVKTSGAVYNIYRSDDKGNNWRVILPGTTSVPIFGTDQGIYDNAIIVFPDDPDRIILGGIDAWQGKKYQDEGYFDFKTISESLTLPLISTYVHQNHHVYTFVPGTTNKFFIGTDGGIFKGEYSSGEYSYETCNRNYYTTQFFNVANSGVKEYVIGGSNNNGTITLPGIGNTSSEGYQLLLGSGGPCAISSIVPNVVVFSSYGTTLRSDDYGATTSNTSQFPGTIFGIPSNLKTPMLLVENFDNNLSGDSLYYHANEDIQGGSDVMVRSINAGQPFYYHLPEDIDLKAGDSIQVQDKVTAYYYLGLSNAIYFTKDIHQFNKVVEWFKISSSDHDGVIGTPHAMAISKNGNYLFVGTFQGKLFRISNLATAYNFERADVTSPECIISTVQIPIYVPGSEEEISQAITSIAVDSENPNNVLVTLGNYGNEAYVMYSSNALDQVPTFSSIQGNLPHMPVYSSVIEMEHSNVGIIGTEYGIFSTNNLMSESPDWTKQYTNMGSVPVFDLKQQLITQPPMTVKVENENEVSYITYPGTNNWGTIYAATFGRGIFMSDDYFIVGQDEIIDSEDNNGSELMIYPNPVKTNAIIEFNARTKYEVNIYVYDLSGRMIKNFKYSCQKGLNEIPLKVNTFSKGTYIINLVADGKNFTGKILVN